MINKNILLIKIINLLEKFYKSSISASHFGEHYEKIWRYLSKKNRFIHPVYDIHLFGELYLDYDAFRKKPSYENSNINEYELKMRCIETVKAIITLEPSLKKYLDHPEILNKKFSILEMNKRLHKNGRILFLSKQITAKNKSILVVWITFDKNTRNYFASIEKWPIKLNKRDKYPKENDYGFNNLKSLFNYLNENKYIGVTQWVK